MSWPRAIAGLLAALVVTWVVAPRERLRLDHPLAGPSPDLQGWLAGRDAGIRSDIASYLHWAGQPGTTTDIAILYVHGFSASPAELRPLPEQVAQAVGANLLAIRLTGHGRGGADLAAATAQDWWNDLGQALAAVQQIGRQVVVIGMSTGATLTALAARDRRMGPIIDGVVLISPNFRLKAGNAWLLNMPFVRQVIRLSGDPQRCFQPRNELHRARWTSCYPMSAVLAVGTLLRQARHGNFKSARSRALFIWSDADRTVDHFASAKVAANWGGAATVLKVMPGPNDDPDAHVIAGDALSPDLTRALVPAIASWIADLP